MTTRSGIVLEAAGVVVEDWAAIHLPDAEAAVIKLASESIIRLTVSHIVLPLTAPTKSAADLAEVFVRILR